MIKQTQSYVFIDVSTRYKFKNNSWQIGLNLQNITMNLHFACLVFQKIAIFYQHLELDHANLY
ncbi:MAG: hypothetical protein U5N85_19670 [Arcicella sp.]|nr:hypothetical protein [Arcicella sp.]